MARRKKTEWRIRKDISDTIDDIVYEDINSYFIDNDYEYLENYGVMYCEVYAEISGSCTIKEHKASVPSGETRVLDEDEIEVTGFDISGKLHHNDDDEDKYTTSFTYDSSAELIIFDTYGE